MENVLLDDIFCKKWRTPVPLWPDCAQTAPPGQPRARPGASREWFGSVRGHSCSAKTPLHAMDKWTRTKYHQQITQTVTKKHFFQKTTLVEPPFRKKWRTPEPLWPDCARKAPTGCPGTRPGAPRERPSSVKKRLIVKEDWTHTKRDTKKQKI